MSIGKELSPVLVEIEEMLWDYEGRDAINRVSTPPEFTDDGLRAAAKIFMSVLIDKMWEHNHVETRLIASQKEMEQKAHHAGRDFRKLIKKYTGKDSHDFYRNS
jgi:hypothetical protein